MAENSKTDLYQIGIKELNGDFSSCLTLNLAAEIVKRPFLTCQKTPITSERYTVDSKHVLNAKRKLW
jgi:hypothetical protein